MHVGKQTSCELPCTYLFDANCLEAPAEPRTSTGAAIVDQVLDSGTQESGLKE